MVDVILTSVRNRVEFSQDMRPVHDNINIIEFKPGNENQQS
jgi:hypothetical protein